jgi:hypothetical protein
LKELLRGDIQHAHARSSREQKPLFDGVLRLYLAAQANPSDEAKNENPIGE